VNSCQFLPRRIFLAVLLCCLTCCLGASGQQAPGTVRGRVTDPSGAVVPKATVTAVGPGGATASAISDAQGNYELKGLAPGTYAIQTAATGFTASSGETVDVTAGQVQRFDIALEIEVRPEKVVVQEARVSA